MIMRIAVAQPAVVPYDVAVNAAAHAGVVRAAGARLVVFPELSLTGYNLDAPPVACDDARLAPVVAACADTGAVALAGAPVVAADGRAYIAMLLVDAGGARVVYRKIHLHPPEDERFSPGPGHVVIELDGLRLGLAICRDASLAEHAAATVAAGAQAYIASTLNSPGDPRDERMHARATTHRIPVVLSCGAGLDGPLLGSGGSGLWRPDGTVIAQAGDAPGEVVVADLP
nr:carbon-nitrogen hydrolase family protein [Actinoplanes digitatis]